MKTNFKKSLYSLLVIIMLLLSGCESIGTLGGTIVTNVSPNRGNVSGGGEVTIYGKNFTSNLKVYFGENIAEIDSISNTAIVVFAPEGQVGKVNIRIVNNTDIENIVEYSAGNYEYYEEEILAPIITGISLNKGLITGGELITIYGKNFGSNLEV
ncbi:MAG: IPT/TIG domain-containing protein, partial [Vulcanibacillus sp.]